MIPMWSNNGSPLSFRLEISIRESLAKLWPQVLFILIFIRKYQPLKYFSTLAPSPKNNNYLWQVLYQVLFTYLSFSHLSLGIIIIIVLLMWNWGLENRWLTKSLPNKKWSWQSSNPDHLMPSHSQMHSTNTDGAVPHYTSNTVLDIACT